MYVYTCTFMYVSQVVKRGRICISIIMLRIFCWYYESFAYFFLCILVKVPCECITENIAPDHISSATYMYIFSVKDERERYFNCFIVVAFLASAALNDSK